MEEEFIHYLIDIGFIDKKTEYEIRDIYHKVISQNNYMKFNEIMTTVLINFLENLTQIQKKFIYYPLFTTSSNTAITKEIPIHFFFYLVLLL